MKRFLVYIAFILFSVQVFAQISPVQTIRVVNLTTAFGSPVPYHYVIVVASDSTKWSVENVDGLVGTETVTSALSAGTIVAMPTKIKGSVQVSVTGLNGHVVLAIPDGTITNAKLANMATKTFKGRSTTGTGVPEDLSVSTVKADLTINNLDNTSDANKPVSTATQTALDLKVDENAAITGATKTKITYGANGLVTDGADATTADITDSSNKRYVTDAHLVILGNTSNTNTGDQTLSGLSGVPTSTTITATSPITIDGTTSADLSANRTIAIIPATTSVPGSMSAADKTKLDGIAAGAGTGTVTSIAAGTGITGGAITTTGTLAIDTTIVAKKTTVAAMYEPKFSKNTGFNKAFGSTSGTVLEGRAFGTAAASATTDFAPASVYPAAGLTTGYLPYKSATVLANSPIYTDGTSVSIGMTELGAKLDLLANNDDAVIRMRQANNPNLYFTWKVDHLVNGAATLYGYDGSTEVAGFTQTRDGNIGVKTTAPQVPLDVVGDIKANNGSIYASSNATPGIGDVTFMTHNGTIGKIGTAYYTGGYTPLTFWTSGVEQVRVLTNGNIIVNGLASTYARLTSTSPTGQLTPITDGAAHQFLNTDGVGGYVFAGLGDAKITYSSTYTFSNDHDIVDKAYVDAVASGNLPKLPVDAATTGNITLSGASQTIDGFAAIAGKRILVWKQTTPSENGVYIVASGAWTRATDLDAWAELYKAYVAVIEGYQNGSSFVCTIPSSGTLESDAVTWVLYGVPTNIVAGTGLTKTGNVLSLNTATSGAIGGVKASASVAIDGSGVASVSTAYDAAGAAAAITPTSLGLVIGTNVQAYNSNLTGINQALTTTSSPNFTTVTANLTGTASAWGRYVDGDGTSGGQSWLMGYDGSDGKWKNISAAVTKTWLGLGASAYHADSYFLTPTGSAANLTSFPTFNQNTTGNAATVTTNANLTGEVTSTGNAATVTNSAVIAKVLTGYTSGAGTVAATDNILQAIQKLNGNAAASTHAPVTIGTANGLSLSTQALSMALSATGVTGALSSTDRATLFAKQDALGFTPYNATNPSNFIPLTALSSTATGLTYTNTTGVFSLASGYFIPTTSILAGTNTGDVSFIVEPFAEFATGANGQYNSLAHTPLNTSNGIQVEYNGSILSSTQFQYVTGTVRVLGQVYANDLIRISYIYK